MYNVMRIVSFIQAQLNIVLLE